MTKLGDILAKRRQHSFLLFASLILVLSMLIGCGPSAEELEAVDYTPHSGDDWEVSTPEEQGLDPELVAELYYNAADVETIEALLVVKDGKLIAEEESSVDTREGAGPRHVDFHPRLPYVYAINELDSTITTYRFERARGVLTPLQIVTTLPSDYTGNNTTAEVWVHPSGRFVYGSNRGHNSIAVFAIDADTGKLRPVGHQSVQGDWPRHFGIDPTEVTFNKDIAPILERSCIVERRSNTRRRLSSLIHHVVGR